MPNLANHTSEKGYLDYKVILFGNNLSGPITFGILINNPGKVSIIEYEMLDVISHFNVFVYRFSFVMFPGYLPNGKNCFTKNLVHRMLPFISLQTYIVLRSTKKYTSLMKVHAYKLVSHNFTSIALFSSYPALLF